MLPVGIVWSITKKMGTTQILGIILGLTLVSPQLLNGFSVASTPAADIPVWDFGFAQVQMIGYQGQVISAMLAGFVLVFLEKFFKKHCPEVVSMIVVPFCSLVPAVVIAHTVVGPIGWRIGDALANVVYNGLFSSFGWLFAGVFGLLYAPLVMTGLHHMTNAIDSQLVNTYEGTILWPMIALSNIAQGSSVLAMSLLQKKNERAQQVNVVSVGFGVEAFSIGVGGLPGILSIKTPYYLPFLAAMAIAVVVPFVLTLIVGSRKLTAAERGKTDGAAAGTDSSAAELTAENGSQSGTAEEASAGNEMELTGEIKSVLSGRVIPIEEVEDNVFSQKIMGDGVAVEPEDTVVKAPADAAVTVVMKESCHACGLTLANGLELLIHVGIDTVDMNGDGFQLFVDEGQKVRAGDPLIQFDPEKIRAAGHPLTTMLIVTGEGDAKNVAMHSGIEAKAAETTVITYE